MDKELRLLLPLLADISEVAIGDTTYYTGLLGGHPVTVCKCGIGKVNAALGCRALIDNFEPELIINTGVAGGTGSAAKVLDVVIADRVAYHDVWCGPGTVPGQAADCPLHFAGSPYVLGMKWLQELPHVKFGLVASGDVFVDSPDTVARIKSMYPDAAGIDMESGALAQTCHRMGIPFICLRVISDTPGEVADNGAQYESFWTAAPQEAFDIVKQIILHL